MVTETVAVLSSGATFFRGDLHIHSFGGSHDVTDSNATPSKIVETAIGEALALIAITDHNEIANIAEAIELAIERELQRSANCYHDTIEPSRTPASSMDDVIAKARVMAESGRPICCRTCLRPRMCMK